MIDPELEAFKWPTEVAAALLNGWDIKLNGETSLVRTAKVLRADINAAVFEGVAWPGLNVWVWWRARVSAHSAKVRFWFQIGYGSRSRTAPTFKRETVLATTGNRYLTLLEAPSTADPRILHGQGVSIKTVEVDFVTGAAEWLVPPAFKETDFVPRYATKTGGKWAYMGLKHDVAAKTLEEWRKELYPMGAYAGQFRHDDGRVLTEADVPDSVVGSHFHERARDRGFIKYTDPDNPWMDRHAFGIREPDDQHNSIIDTVVQVHLEHPDDEGLAMLVENSAEYWLKALPGHDKGTTHHRASSGRRGPGRNLKAFSWMHVDLERTKPALADKIALRAGEHWLEVRAAVLRNFADRGHPWTFFGGRAVINPSEVGIFFWGLYVFDRYLNALGVDDPEIGWLKDAAAKFCFDRFHVWPSGAFGIAWTVDGKTFEVEAGNSKPTSSHFAWLAATSYEPTTTEEHEKLERIKALEVEPRFRGF